MEYIEWSHIDKYLFENQVKLMIFFLNLLMDLCI